MPWGVDVSPATQEAIAHVRRHYRLPERFVLYVGTLEPRKNLRRLADAARRTAVPLPLVVVGPDGWGDAVRDVTGDVRFLGFVPADDLAALYAAASVFAYPSERRASGSPSWRRWPRAHPS